MSDSAKNIIGSIDTNVLGDYFVSYSVVDAAANATVKIRQVSVITPADTVAPVITGTEDKEVAAGDTFDPLEGIKAIDAVDGDVTANIKVTLEQ